MYLAPRVETVIYGADLMQHEVITTSPTGADQEAKETNEFIEEESLPVDKNIWEDDEE